MKKWIALLLALVMTVSLCACEEVENIVAAANSAQLTENGKKPAAEEQSGAKGQPASLPETVWSEMTVTFSFGPEVELVMNEHFQCLSGKGLNEAGEALLEGIDLEDRTHYMLFKEILRKAQEQGLLEQTTRLEITAQSQDSSIWHLFFKEILSLPVQHYMEESGVYFLQIVKLPKSAPAQFVAEHYEAVADQGEGWAYEGNKDHMTGLGKLRWTFAEYEKISYTFRDVDYIDLCFYADGSFCYIRNTPNGSGIGAAGKAVPRYLSVDCAETTDGRWYTATTHMLEDGTNLGSEFKENNGTHYERIYDEAGNSKILGFDASCVIYPEPIHYEESHGANGQITAIKRWTADGTVVEDVTYHANGNIAKSYFLGENGEKYEITYYENENWKSRNCVYADGVTEEVTYYEDGSEKTYKCVQPDQSVYEYAFDGSGNRQYLKIVDAAGSMELFYENGALVKVTHNGETFEDAATLSLYMGY